MPEYPDRLAQAIRELSRLMVGDEGLDATLDRIATLTCRVIPECDFASVTMLRGDRLTTAVASDSVAIEVDNAQYRAEAGPCVQAVKDQQICRLDDISDVSRWPEFRAAATQGGIASSLSLPMSVSDRGVGAMNLYAKVPAAFSGTDHRTALLFAEQAAVACLNAERYWSTYNIVQHLEEALKSRDVIGQAKGILMERHRIDADDAFDRLRKESQRSNRRLRDLADDLAATGEWPPTAAG